MFRITKINGQWVLVSSDLTYIFVQIQYRDIVHEQHDKWTFVPFLANIEYEHGKASFTRKPKIFNTQQEGEQFIKDNNLEAFFQFGE